MKASFRPARSINERHGLFVALAGGTNSGKSFSAMRLARGIAGPQGKVAAIDTEGGRILHLKSHFDFDVMMMDAPHRPARYADAARDAEDANYDCVVIDSFSMEWVGLGGVLDWQDEEYQRMGAREAVKLASWIKPKVGHKAMVYSLLQRRIPIVFSLRAEEKAKKVGNEVKSEWAPIQNKTFPFEVTVSFMLMQNRQGIVDLSLAHKMEGDHKAIFRDGDQLSEEHGQRLAAWAKGGVAPAAPAGPDGWPMLAPDATLKSAPDAHQWVRWCGAAVGKLEDVPALDEWLMSMGPHFAALDPFDADAVAAVRRLAGDRRHEMMGGSDA